jgi:hypothetical protein
MLIIKLLKEELFQETFLIIQVKNFLSLHLLSKNTKD